MKNRFAFIVSLVVLGAIMPTVRGYGEVPPPPPGHDEECEDNLIFRKWNDVLFVNNGESRFVAYQWYQDDTPIAGANDQVFHLDEVILSGDGHLYYAIATETNGHKVTCCARTFDEFPASQPLNPAGGARKATLYNSTGHLIGEWENKPSSLPLPQGYYIWCLTDEDGNTWSEKMLVP